jgi:hypothetical protein
LKNIKQLKLDSTNNSNKIVILLSQINAIKIRDGIKVFIDYIFVSLNQERKNQNKKLNNYNQFLIKNIII